eukprot:3888062-Alexandrium_andersonii.AAC.1
MGETEEDEGPALDPSLPADAGAPGLSAPVPEERTEASTPTLATDVTEPSDEAMAGAAISRPSAGQAV